MSISPVNLAALVGYAFEPFDFRYTERDASLYALSIGGASNPLDTSDLRFVYEQHADGFNVFPTFAVIFPSRMIDVLLSGGVPGLAFDPLMLLHGEQDTEIRAPLPTSGVVTCKPVISAIYDKGKGALVITDVPCYDENGTEIAFHRYSMYIRGLGGFGGERGASSEVNVPPDRAPDAVTSEQTMPNQALIYRLSGDTNPLHADPMRAAFAGFDRPILHGLCTFGYAARAVLRTFADNDAARFKRIRVRFAKHVFPGETLLTEMWDMGDGQIVFRVKVAERDEVVLSHAAVELVADEQRVGA